MKPIKRNNKKVKILDANMIQNLPITLHPIYNQRKARQKLINKYLKEEATKVKMSMGPPIKPISDDFIPISQEKYVNELRQYANQVTVHPMFESWEYKIVKMISSKLKLKFPTVFSTIMSDCKSGWNDSLHELVVKKIIRDVPGRPRIPYVEKEFKYGGRTQNFANFLKTTKKLNEKLVIGHPLMRYVLSSSVKIFPLHLVDLREYKKGGFSNIDDLVCRFQLDLKKSEVLVINTWYPQLLHKAKYLHSNTPKWFQLLRCTTKFASMQILELMRRSIEHIIDVTKNSEIIPILNMELKLGSDLYLNPSFDEIFLVYHGFLDSIIASFQNLACLECIIDLSLQNSYFVIRLNEAIVKDYHNQLQMNLEEKFKPIMDYIINLKNNFSELIQDSLFNVQSLDDAFEKLEHYDALNEQICSLLNNEYFDVGKLSQIDVITNLMKNLSYFKNKILNELCLNHKKNSQSICDQFEEISKKATKTPLDASELIELGAYCLHVKTEVIQQLGEQIAESVLMMIRLIEKTMLTQDHISINTKMINWLKDIIPILEVSSINFEQTKYEMEEVLMAKTNSLIKKVVNILPYLDILDEMDDINCTLTYLEDIRRLVHWIEDCDKEVAWINREESVFKFPLSQYSELEELKNYVLPFYDLMYLLHKWRRSYYSWMDGPFEYINNQQVESQHEMYFKEFNKIFKNYKNKIKQQIIDGKERHFKGSVDDPDPMNYPAPMKLCTQAINELKEWRPWVHLVNIMCNPALRQRHLDEMSKLAGVDLTPNAGTTIRKMIDLNLWSDMEKYEIISIGATKELALITNLDAMIDEWKSVKFQFKPHKDTNIKVLSQTEDVQAILDDHLVKAITMRGSTFAKPFESKVKSWFDKLVRMNKALEEWGKVQTKWLYFLPLFSVPNIVAQMPGENSMFQTVDKEYNKYINQAIKNPSVIEIAGGYDLLKSMESSNELLEKVTNGVNNYIESKRLFFGRFFFLSMDEILEILSETNNCENVQPHLKKCFEGIESLDFDKEFDILGMISKENEYVKFCNTISTSAAAGSVEKWLFEVEQEMFRTVRDEIKSCYLDYVKTERKEWLSKWEGMVILCVSQMYWAADIHEYLKSSKNLGDFLIILKERLNELVTLIRSSSISALMRISIKALIVIDVHAMDVVQDLINKKVCSDSDFYWLCHLRYYWMDDNVMVRIINAEVQYGYEYLGNSDRLVITPLTDRCYRTLIGAYSLHLNGAPEGPAGTGKTETTKDLAKALAKQCVVFNCSEGLDYLSMGRFFKGFAVTGAWACFDEFNRIDVEVLSVIAQQILSIVHAVRQKAKEFYFEGTLLQLNPTCYICITMNPGYAGRSELPDNLKILFRTVAMMVPDYAMIAEISLYSCGYSDARNLSVKIVTMFRLCSEQLSSQNHYEYGMRAVKAVLRACCENKKLYPDEREDVMIYKSIRDTNLSKFLSFDIPLFANIMADIFPDVNIQTDISETFVGAVRDICRSSNIEPTEYFITKLNQAKLMMEIRHGFMMVGDPASGKSTILKIMHQALCQVNGYDHKKGFKVINPKSVHINLLFGYNDIVTQEWYDGVVGNIFRSFSLSDYKGIKWIIFDGPVDALWIENMNTVLDDNKKLCLNSGEVIAMPNLMSMVFEVMDLSQASPATVSRCGMIYLESVSLGYLPFVKSWIRNEHSKWKENYEQLLEDLCEWLFPQILQFLKKIERSEVSGGMINLIVTTLNLIDMLMVDAVAAEEDVRYFKTWIQASFILGTLWGFGGYLPYDSKIKFDEFVREIWKGEQPIPESLEKIDVSMPAEGLIYDYIYQYKQKGVWKPWQELSKSAKIIERMNVQEIVVPTVDALKSSFFLDLHIRYKKPMMLIGPTGTGKTFYIRDYMTNRLSVEKYTPILYTFTTTTSAKNTQEFILSKLYKRRNNRYTPSKGKEAILFIDDVSMPVKELYGAQPAIEILRQYLDYGKWFDLKTLKQIYISKVLPLATMGAVGGSKQLIYPRFLRHFALFSLHEFNDETIAKIFSSVFNIGLRRNSFGSDVTSSINSIVNATLKIYSLVKKQLLPTITQPHYMFNIRDFSRLIQGCSLIKKDSADDKKVFIKLWIHESLRVFGDRLNNDTDRDWFVSLLDKYTQTQFKDNIKSVCDNYVNENGEITKESLNGLIFGTFLDTDSLDEDKKYEEICNFDTIYRKAVDALEEFNSTNRKTINIVLFRYALIHLSRICRVLSIHGGSCLLIGVSGSGRQSLVRLASIIMGKTLFQPEITKDYNLKSWHSDMKTILMQTGGKSKETIFLVSENQLIDERFIEDIDNLLNCGEIPGLFDLDEQQEILELVRLDAQGGNRNLDISPLQVLTFFTNRCKTKLHICMCLNPIGSAFRNKLRLYPSLINCCTIDWYDTWPKEALHQVAEQYLETLNVSDAIKSSLPALCTNFHTHTDHVSNEHFKNSNQRVYVTSGSYLNLINLFTDLITRKQNELMAAKKRYTNGLEKLSMAADAVLKMQEELNNLKPQLIIMAAKSTKMMEEIEKETIEADKATVLVKEDEKIANEQAAAAQALKKDCEADLALAIPILEDAIASLNTLKPADITLVKSMKNPPAAIKLVMAAVCVMMSVPPDRIPDPANPGRMMLDYWGPSKRLLGDMALLQNLKEYDKDNIPVSTMAKIRKEYLPHKDFKPPIVAKASTAAEGLCKWVIAMDMYDGLAKVVAPKKAKLLAAENEFAATMAVLNEKKAMVARLEQKVADLNVALEEANTKRQQLEDEVELCINKLYRAEKLISGLGGEKTRWTNSAEELQKSYDNLPGDVILSCGMIAYLSPFPTKIRAECLDSWKRAVSESAIPFTGDYSFGKILGNDIEIQHWYMNGLPSDQVSTENAIIQNVSPKWSLFMDPKGQANKWIKTLEKPNELKIVKLTDKNHMTVIKTCIEFGMPVLIENVFEEIPVSLDPILLKQTFLMNGIEVLSIGDLDIEYNDKFRLYVTTKTKNPHYSPEVFHKMTVINFALSISGLEDQLLGIVVAKERPDLQEQRETLIQENSKNNATLKSVENKILKTLQETKGDILEDEAAIEILDSSKLLANDIIERNKASKITEKMINDFRQSYYPIAQHSAQLYYSISDLSNINYVYQFSLVWFINLYVNSIKMANRSNNLNKRLQYLKDTFTYNLYCNVCRSLLDEDKLTFSFILCIKILMMSNIINEVEYNLFLTGGRSTDENEKKLIDWLPDKSWNEIGKLCKLSKFNNFKESMVENSSSWKKIYDSLEPQNEPLPGSWNDVFSPFEKLLLMRIIRPDKIRDSIMLFVKNNLGKQFVEPPPFNLSESFAESNCLVPLIFILSPGSDPIFPLTILSEKMGYKNKLQIFSLGQGQGAPAELAIKQCQREGSWVCLQNCHLAISWMSDLESIIESFDLINTDLSFRLWLTTYPSESIPQSILQNGIKMTNESPSGLKNNLHRLYTSEPLKDPSFYEGCSGNFKIFSKLLYGISYFHAVVQERKKFGSLGWNIPYGFDDSDYLISITQLQIFLNQYEDVPYVALTYLIGECNYGGRVTDDWDRRLITTLLQDYLNPNVVSETRYSFSNTLPRYNLPLRFEYRDYLEHINRIPDECPELFGLNTNAGIFKDRNISAAIVDSLIKLQYEDMGSASSGDSEEILMKIVSDTMSKLSFEFNIDDARTKFPIDYNESMNIFLIQEMERYNALLGAIRSSLSNIEKGVNGLCIMTPIIESDAEAILLNRIPNTWLKFSYPSAKNLGNYVADLEKRINMLKEWSEHGKPTTFWISGFFFTQAFLTGGMQNYARVHKISIDNLVYDCKVMDGKEVYASNKLYIEGLFIDGARWNSEEHVLDEQHPKILNEAMPNIQLCPMLKTEFAEGDRYKCPIYRTSERRGILSTTGHSTNFVLPLMLPSDRPVAHWVKRSTALLLQLNDN